MLVAQNSYSLPSFEVRTCLETVSNLKLTLDALASDLVPKKRFSFKNKKAPISEVNVIEAETRVTQSETRDSSGFEDREVKAPSSGAVSVIESETRVTELGKPSFRVWDSPGFKGRENEVLVREFKGMEMGEFSISDLSSCEVRLIGCLRALFVHKLRDCKVYVGPVFGSVLIEEVEGCVFVLASHQIRIHHTKGSDFYLRVRSRPIIEDCIGVRFAPYCLGYDGIERDLKESNLDEETGNWANVDDFRWLKAVQSPNWSILPESERIDRVTIMNSDK